MLLRVFLRSILERAKYLFMVLMSCIIRIDSESAVFSSYSGINYSDSPRYISEKMKEISPQKHIYWIMRRNADTSVIPPYVDIIYKGTIKSVLVMVKCRLWVFNDTLPLGVYKRKKQIYVQTYHGDRVPKKILYDQNNTVVNNYRTNKFVINEPKTMTYGIAGSELGERVYRTAFRFKGEVINIGMPRNDCLVKLNKQKVVEIKEKLGVSDKKILLYAPTFRDNARKVQVVEFDLKGVREKLEQKTGEKWIIFIRKHKATNALEYTKGDGLIDVSDYNEMAELLMISDMLVSDYSSSVGDFILLNRPILLYQPDYDEYKKECRDFNFDLKKSGYVVANTMDEIYLIIERINEYDFTKINKSIMDKLGINESGKSAEIIAARLISEMKG